MTETKALEKRRYLNLRFSFFILTATISISAFAQNKKLLLINSENTDTISFVAGDQIKIRSSLYDTEIRGTIRVINDSSFIVGRTLVSLNSLQYLKKINSTGMVITKAIGITIAAIGLFGTYVIAGLRPTQPEDLHQQDEYEEDMQDYREGLAICLTATVFGASTLLIHNPKYKLNKGWRTYVLTPADAPGVDSVKSLSNESKLNDSDSLLLNNRTFSKDATYLQFSYPISYSVNYDHIWKINNTLNFSVSSGIGSENRTDDFVIPLSIGCVIGKKQHRIEIGQMTWFGFDSSNPSLLGILAYRFQSYKGQIFFRGGMQIIEISDNYYENIIYPFGSIGIGF